MRRAAENGDEQFVGGNGIDVDEPQTQRWEDYRDAGLNGECFTDLFIARVDEDQVEQDHQQADVDVVEFVQEDGDARDAAIEKAVGYHETLHGQYSQPGAGEEVQEVLKAEDELPVNPVILILSGHCQAVGSGL